MKGKWLVVLLLCCFTSLCFAQLPDTIDGQRVLSFSQEMPKFQKDVMKYMVDSLQFIAINDEQVQSHVYASFIIDTAGNVCRPIISHPAIAGKISRVEEAVLDVIRKMPKWTPSYQDGKVVPVRYDIPVIIDFR